MILIVFVYTGLLDYDWYRTTARERDPENIFIKKINRSSLLDIMIENQYLKLNDSANVSNSTRKTVNEKFPRIFCIILTHPQNFKEKVKTSYYFD